MSEDNTEATVAEEEPATKAKTKPKKKNRNNVASTLLGPTLIQLIAMAPGHKTYRALVSKAAGKLLPGDLATYQQIVHWLEYDIPSRMPPSSSNELVLNYDCSETEMGTANYTCARYGTSTVAINTTKMRQLVQSCDGWDQLMDEVDDLANEIAGNNVDWSDAGNFQYDNHEPEDSENFSCSSSDSIETWRSRVKNFIYANFPGDYDRLMGS